MPDLSLKLMLDILGITILMAGGAAWVTGRAMALAWQRLPLIGAAAIGLGLTARFIDYALFAAPFTWSRLLLDTVVALAAALAGYLLTRRQQMQRQYPWLQPG